MTWQIWFACAAIVLAVVGLVKRYETRMVLLLAGFAMCIVGGDPMKAFQAFVYWFNRQKGIYQVSGDNI